VMTSSTCWSQFGTMVPSTPDQGHRCGNDGGFRTEH
jgi:hypothetical protein